MIDAKLLGVLLATVALAGGCKSGPAKVCDKIDQLTVKAMADGDDKAKSMAEKMQAEASTCITRMSKMEQDDPETFAKASECIEGATELKGVVACFFQAALGDKKQLLQGK